MTPPLKGLSTTPKTVAARLGLKAGMDVFVLLPPPDVVALIGPLPVDSHVKEKSDRPCAVVLLFARNSNELVRWLPGASPAVAAGGKLWVAFYKKASGMDSDINRDLVREHALTLGMEPIAILSIDGQWSALRLKQM